MTGLGVLLIDQKVDWYRWRIEIRKVHLELLTEYDVNDPDVCFLVHTTKCNSYGDRNLARIVQPWCDYYQCKNGYFDILHPNKTLAVAKLPRCYTSLVAEIIPKICISL